MERKGDEVHVETDEARGASSPNIVRWVLLVSLFAAIALLSIIWITGAATQGDVEEEATVSGIIRSQNDEESDTDSIVDDRFDEIPGAGAADEDVDTVRTIENDQENE